MKPRSSSTARIAAAGALALAAILAIVVIASTIGGGTSAKRGHGRAGHHKVAKKRHVPASYEVQSGDTLISIAHRTGVPVREIEALNPQVDPQILIAGEKLKLK